MRQVFSRLVVATGLLALACATAEDAALSPDDGGDTGGSVATGGSSAIAGSINNTSGSENTAGTVADGGKGGTGTNAFGGTSTTAGTTSMGGTISTGGTTSSGGKGGTASGGGGSGGGGSGGTSSGGKGGSGGTAAGGGGSGGTAAGGGGSGSGGTTSATCSGVADWANTTYKVGDIVADTCKGVFAGTCTAGQKHKFECNPPAGAQAVAWCQQREPGVGNGWAEAWVDKGQCN